jgi:hypothetical protein
VLVLLLLPPPQLASNTIVAQASARECNFMTCPLIYRFNGHRPNHGADQCLQRAILAN